MSQLFNGLPAGNGRIDVTDDSKPVGPDNTTLVINGGNDGGFISGYRQAAFGTLTPDVVPGFAPQIVRFEGNTTNFSCRIRFAGNVKIPGVEEIFVTGKPVGGGGDIPATFRWSEPDGEYSVTDFAFAALFLQLGEGTNQDMDLTFVAGYSGGIPTEDGRLAIDTSNPITHYHMGIPYTAQGRIAASLEAPVDRYGPSTTPYDAADRVAMSAAVAIGEQQFGVSYTTSGQVAVNTA